MGEAGQVDAKLDIAPVSEGITVIGQKPETLPAVTPSDQQSHAGSTVQPLKLIHQVEPTYPAELKQLGVEGTVVIRAVVSVNGNVLSPEVISAGVDPRLFKLAAESDGK